ncbi:MAG: chorismate lyase [Pseudomonadota bacterium]
MSGRAPRLARWHGHLNALSAPAGLRPWLAGGGSLTAKLKAHAGAFRVQLLMQAGAPCLGDEARAIGLAPRARVWQREVLLRCEGVPVVFGHTVVPLSATASDWPLFNALGERSLGSTLFGDRRVRRGALQFARLGERHPLAARARAALGLSAPQAGALYARRCLYRRGHGLLLVTEVFLPAVLALTPLAAAPPARAVAEPGATPFMNQA